MFGQSEMFAAEKQRGKDNNLFECEYIVKFIRLDPNNFLFTCLNIVQSK